MPRVPSVVSEWVPVVLRLPLRAQLGIVTAIVAGAAARLGWLAEPLGMTRPTEIAFGIVIVAGALWLTEAVPLFVTSLVILALELVWLAPVLEAPPGGSALFLNAFFSDVTLLFLGGFVLSTGIERTRLDRTLTRGLLRRVGRSPRRVLFAMMLATTLLGIWMSNTAACALMLGAAGSLIARLPAGDGLRKALPIGIAFSANLGGLATPVSSPPNAIVMRYLEAEGIAPSFSAWMALGMPILLVLQLVLLVYLGRRFPSGVAEVPYDEEPAPPTEGPQILVLLVFALTVAGWVFAGSLELTAGTVALLPVVVFFGTNLLRTSDLRAMPWDVILLIGGGIALGAAVDQAGLSTWVGERIPTDGLPSFAVLGVVAVLAVLVSSMMSNTAAVNLLAPVVIGLGSIHHAAILLVLAFACTMSMPLPVSTPPNAMAYGFSVRPDGKGEFSAGDMIRPGMFITLVGLAVLAVFTWLWFPRIIAI